MKPGGGYNRTSKWMRTIFYVNKVVLHHKYEEYESTHNDTHIKPNPYDIAMIRLHRSVDFTRVNNYYKINSICLPQKNDTQEKEELVQVMGWGLIDHIDNKPVLSKRLQMGYMNVLKTSNDVDDYHGKILVLVRSNNESAISCNVSIIMKV